MHCLFKEHKTHQNEIEIDIPLFTLFVHGSMGLLQNIQYQSLQTTWGKPLVPTRVYFL